VSTAGYAHGPNRLATPEPRARLSLLIAASAILLLVAFTTWVFVVAFTPQTLQEVARKHFLYVVGTPVSCMVAFIVLGAFRATSGPIQFKALGFEFQGAAGPVVLWLVVYLGCVGGMVALWAAPV
jgi:hypothetical protein